MQTDNPLDKSKDIESIDITAMIDKNSYILTPNRNVKLLD